MGNKKIETTEHLVAYLQMDEHYVASLDILGAKEYIDNDVEHEKLNLIYSTFQKAKSRLENENSEIKEWLNQAECKIFSDNIIIYLKSLNGQSNKAIFQPNYFLNLIRQIQCLFFEQNILVRGGVTVGEFFGDDMMVWGKALVEAYKLESECAIYPRILLSQKYLKNISNTDIIADIVSEDKDTLYYIDYLYFYNRAAYDFKADGKFEINEQELEIVHFKDKCKEQVDYLQNKINYYETNCNNKTEKIKAKYGWVITYLKYKLEFPSEMLSLYKSQEEQNEQQ